MTGPTRLTRRNAGVLALTVALFLAAVAIQRALPGVSEDRDAWASSFKVTGELGRPLELRAGSVTVSHLRLAHSLVDDDKAYGTPGVWVLVDYRYVGSPQASTLWAKLVTADGVEYSATARLPSLGISYWIDGDPGLPEQGVLAFEVPQRDLAGAAVTLDAETDDGIFLGDGVFDTEAVVPLGVDDARAGALLRAAQDRVVVSDG